MATLLSVRAHGKENWSWPELTHLAGNSQGNVILFEPSTSEHISRRTIFDPITALAPAADCQTYAIGWVMFFGCG